ncbi:N-6 DNA methylase [uncultured Microbulbifer sp.]|uniref:N-6 DNA methylase n=1 Tax=uncultured Microbulbifer sp. TaxID=348147 RepID=UPI002600CC46|nr:N-6 DNA methylase [uncultured Microbulbifer sp.]
MKSTKTTEAKRLLKVDALVNDLVERHSEDKTELRLQFLEAAASRIGGFSLKKFQKCFQITPIIDNRDLLEGAQDIVQALDDTGIHTALCLSALARESLDSATQRRNGAYHTDFRLALHLARSVEEHIEPGIKVVDPACGAGILLTAVSIIACGSDRILANEWLKNSVYASDLSPLALRGTLLSLSSLTDDIESLKAMRSKWLIQDSLLADDYVWSELAPSGFNIVVANPPWEKVKLTRHEYIKSKGETRNYGTSYDSQSLTGYESEKSKKANHATALVDRYPTLAHGEPDLYVAFTELLLKLTAPNGNGAILVPAGLIRSKNTMNLRSELINSSKKLTFTVMENKARHFAIDTRFKFTLVNYTKATLGSKAIKSVNISHATSSEDEVCSEIPVTIPVKTLKSLRPDLTLPEVRSDLEWRLFKKMQAKQPQTYDTDSPWLPSFCREVDMTHSRPWFLKNPKKNALPLIEGRMVQPFRLGCKSYVSGEGRSAKWENLPPGFSEISPQFFMPSDAISEKARERTLRTRIGFCDITGQSNERSMMATLIPAGVVCGNKVPTLEFVNDPSEDRLLLWIAIVNSLPFDWLLRRVITTTVNYFVLLSVRLPAIDIDSLPAQRLIKIARKLIELDSKRVLSVSHYWKISELRAEVDVIVANAYGCTENDLKIILRDFPLLDRQQKALPDERKSTVTSDLLISTWQRRTRKTNKHLTSRLSEAKAIGAIPYLSSEFSASTLALGKTKNEQ